MTTLKKLYGSAQEKAEAEAVTVMIESIPFGVAFVAKELNKTYDPGRYLEIVKVKSSQDGLAVLAEIRYNADDKGYGHWHERGYLDKTYIFIDYVGEREGSVYESPGNNAEST